MAKLLGSYTDTRGRTHQVEHVVVPSDDKDGRECVVEELIQALTS